MLVDRSLVAAQPQAVAMRYRLLETVRQYAEARLVERGAWELMRRRHAEYFLGLIEAGEEVEGSGPRSMARPTGAGARQRACRPPPLPGRGQSDHYGRIGPALKKFWRQFGHRNEARRWLEEALDRESDMSATVRAEALQTAAEIVFSNGDYRGARMWFERAVDNWRGLGIASVLAMRWGTTDVQSFSPPRPPTNTAGKALMEEGIGVSREAGRLWWAAWNM